MPPWASIILLDMKRPSPVPPVVVDLVANFVNSLGNISGSIPIPVSLILTKTSLFFFSADYPYHTFICEFNSIA